MKRRVDLAWVLLALAATALGLWLGTGAVDVSPVVTQAPAAPGAGG